MSYLYSFRTVQDDKMKVKKVKNIFKFNGIKNFTGKVVDYNGCAANYKDGKIDPEVPIEFFCSAQIPPYFTGYCMVDKSRFYHMKNGQPHREDGPAYEHTNGEKNWYYEGKCYGFNDSFTNESWKEKVMHLSAIPFVDELAVNKTFTGIAKIHDAFYHYKNGEIHRDDGPAIIWNDGYKHWYQKGDLHRESGPAIECPDGSSEWYLYGLRHREGGPAIDNDIAEWWLHGIQYSEKEYKEKLSLFIEKYNSISDVPKDFTGICKLTNTNYICHMKDRRYHNENGPAIIEENGRQAWYYMGNIQGYDDAFTNETWKEKVKELKTQQEKSNIIEFKNFCDAPPNFTGVCKFICDNSIRHYKNGLHHREGGPAVILENGDLYYYINGSLHRTNGPAFDCVNGHKEWFVNGKCHRFDGPAIERENGTKEWFIDGISYSENEFKKKVKLTNDFIDDCVASISKSKNDKPKSNLPKIVAKATYRVASTQITNIVKESLIKIISKDRNQAIQILNSEFGKAIIQAICGIVANEINSDNIYVEKISQELLTSSIATVGDVLFDTINTQIPEMLQKTISNFSKPAGTRISNVTNDSIDEIEDETSQNLSLTL